jgi:hypothetical protein
VNIPFQRLYNQHISQPRFTKPDDIVKWMGAVQAQDYLGSLWAIGLRLKSSNEQRIEKAIEEKKIVRSWPMRGTLHFVAAEDLRWMLKLLTPRIIQRCAGLYKQAGLDNKVLTKSGKLFSAALKGGQQLTRNELYAILERSKISTGKQRGLHILGHLAQTGLICFGPRNGKQQTFVLLDEWLEPVKAPEQEEALAKLTTMYFRSHGPATVYDFSWWSGLTITEVKKAVQLIRSQLVEETLDGRSYWMSESKQAKPPANVFLLPNFDEYFVAYKDRSAAFSPEFSKEIKQMGSGIFSSPIIINGRMAGFWKRSFARDEVVIETKTFISLSKSTARDTYVAASGLGKFLRMPVVLSNRNG